MNKEEFINELLKLKIKVTSKQLSQLDLYYNLLYTENQKYNLTNIIEKEKVYLKHFYDSLTIVKTINLKNQSLIDMGTGAGFPGLVLKIIFPSLKVTLLDSTTKKCHFLEMVISKLRLKDIEVINARAEDYSHKVREKYDIVTSRAMAPLKHLLEYGIPLLKINGEFIALKSNLNEELTNITNYYQKLGLATPQVIKFKLPYENSNRTIYKVIKIKKTPIIYPRPYNLIKKKDI